ncbi:amidase [Stigmatella sp. ncwal1]|uniref:Amidase n=1 Tax=Stigmatella ashevillensis TaxID=2995309 RepID=A0ABT5DIE2_9BACT|nr:amidase [Stigmatella ashevillena]MDC0713427.1 amidase [Stigmatella ashevillena]
MHLNEYIRFDGMGLASLVQRKEVSAAELVQTAFKAIEVTNPALNAVIATLEDEAQATLARGLPQGPFAGVPFLIKDLGVHAAHIPSSQGTRTFKGLALPHDTALMARYRRAGLVLVGRTNAPELGLSNSTEPLAWGPTRNPWNLKFSPGGSSGGSAAAVSAGMVPMAYGNDGGGSIRMPASMCGLFGMKPTRGRITSGPDSGELLNGFGVEHVLTRSVRDSAAMLDASAGPAAGDPYLIPPPERSFLEESLREPGRLRIAVCRKAPAGDPVSPECLAALDEAVRLCASLGHELVEASPPYQGSLLENITVTLWSTAMVGWMEGLAALAGLTLREEDFERTSWAALEHGRRVSGAEVQAALARLNQFSRGMGSFFEEYDLLLTPTFALPSLPLGLLDANAPLTFVQWMRRLYSFCPFTTHANATGQPAMSVPLSWSAEGFPIGAHFVGRWGAEATLFRLAGQLERAQPWAHRWPAHHAGAIKA